MEPGAIVNELAARTSDMIFVIIIKRYKERWWK